MTILSSSLIVNTKGFWIRESARGSALTALTPRWYALTEELALRQAKRADREIARGNYRGMLHGIPWGVKDLFAVSGYRTTWGVESYKDRVIDKDATVVARLSDAGAVLLAKLSTGAFASGDFWFGGRTRSPWNTEIGSSGSSAGPGAATAAGLVGFSIGSETISSCH